MRKTRILLRIEDPGVDWNSGGFKTLSNGK